MNTIKCNAWKFNPQSTQMTPPRCSRTDILDKAFTDDHLTRAEKDEIARMLYGTSSSHSPSYKRLGWAWHMTCAKQIRRILVSFKYEEGTFRTYYAPDKTSLRLYLTSVSEMIYANPSVELEDVAMDEINQTCIES